MAGLASGFECPECGSVGDKKPHVIEWIRYDEWTNYPIETRMHCMSCEALWNEEFERL